VFLPTVTDRNFRYIDDASKKYVPTGPARAASQWKDNAVTSSCPHARAIIQHC